MHNLRPAILEQGLAAALHWIALRFERRTGVECTIRLPTKPLELPPGVPLVAYRTAQEALTNISKHAQATRVQIDLVDAPAACSRSRSATTAAASARTTSPRRARSASAACTSGPTPSAAGSTCRAGRTARR